MRLLSIALLFSAVAVAQQVQVTAPSILVANVDRPFAGGIGRYQQWYAPASLQGAVLEPMRLEQLEFFAGTMPGGESHFVEAEGEAILPALQHRLRELGENTALRILP